MTYVLLAAGFLFLIKGADLLVNGASSIAKRFGISDLVIGLTVVAFGTSSPELFVNIIASLEGNTGIAIGNILGSNIANVFLILGVASIIFPLAVTGGTVWKEIPLALLAALVLGVLANDRLIDGAPLSALTRTDGLVLLAFFSIFLIYSFSIAKKVQGMENHLPAEVMGPLKSTVFIVLGLAGLTLGGKWIVDGAVHIASSLGVSQALIGVTVVAIGTSLPELATSAVAAFRKNADIAVGNVVGSCIFNIFLVLGVSSVIKPLPFRVEFNLDIGAVILGGLLLFAFMFTGGRRRLDRWEGILFVSIYIAYIVLSIIRG